MYKTEVYNWVKSNSKVLLEHGNWVNAGCIDGNYKEDLVVPELFEIIVNGKVLFKDLSFNEQEIVKLLCSDTIKYKHNPRLVRICKKVLDKVS